jgi:FkbM family methyltransferase
MLERQPRNTSMREMQDFLNLMRRLDFSPRTIVDVGVAYGTPPLYAAFPDAYYCLFEPVSDFEPHLKAILTTLRGEYTLSALSDRPGTSALYVGNQVDGASLMHQGIDTHDPHLRSVHVSTLDQVFCERSVEGPLLLKTDCQGGDLNVIKGGKRFVQTCDVVIMEVGMYHYWGPQTPDFSQVIEYMHSAGFVPYDLFGYLPRPLDGALGQIDIAFVKENGPLRRSHAWT